MRKRTTTILFIILLFLANGILFAQTDSLNLTLKDKIKSKSVKFGIGMYSYPNQKNKISLYLTASYYAKINNNLNLGGGIEFFDNSTKHINSFIIGFFLNPVFKFNILRNKISFGMGGELFAFLQKEGSSQNSMAGWFLFTLEGQYNINETYSVGLEYKTLTLYPFLLNTNISYNF